MSKWQSIDTAPKDGTKVLTWHPSCGIIINSRHPKQWWHSRPHEQPHYWMPLPEPPTPGRKVLVMTRQRDEA
jgi:hypothetical protein